MISTRQIGRFLFAALALVGTGVLAAHAITVTGTDSRLQTSISKVGFVQMSAANAITAFAGGGQASARQLADGINRVTTVATAADSVKLPAAKAGLVVVVINSAAANSMNVFPATGEIVNALAANAAYAIAANKAVIFICAVDGTWNTVLTA